MLLRNFLELFTYSAFQIKEDEEEEKKKISSSDMDLCDNIIKLDNKLSEHVQSTSCEL